MNTMTITTHDLVFTEESTYISTPCPPYCTLKPLHPVDNLQGEGGDFRIHGDHYPGVLLSGYAEEYTHAPGVLRVKVDLAAATFDDPAGLRKLATDALSAAEWLESRA